MTTEQKIQAHEKFWTGKGPGLIFIPHSDRILYDMTDYEKRFNNPEEMWKGEVARAETVIGWPTDGIPVIRPNTGVITLPALAGQTYTVTADSMPWPGQHLGLDEIRKIRDLDISESRLYSLVKGFYAANDSHPHPEIKAYMADNQGVFDIAHLLYGDNIFYSLMEPDKADEVKEIMDRSLDLFLDASWAMKKMNHEPDNRMIHGHGTAQGLYFPETGIRISEDTATLVSPDMIEDLIIPYIKKSAEPFGGAFLHYCGLHPTIFDQLTGLDCIKAVDLGNPEKYDIKALLKRCAETDTVFYCRVPGLENESWKEYVVRIATLVQETGARVVLRPLVIPETAGEAEEMLGIWHEMTDVK